MLFWGGGGLIKTGETAVIRVHGVDGAHAIVVGLLAPSFDMALQIHPQQQGLLRAVGVPVAHHLVVHGGALGIPIPVDQAAVGGGAFIGREDIGLAQQQIVVVEANVLPELPGLVELVGPARTRRRSGYCDCDRNPAGSGWWRIDLAAREVFRVPNREEPLVGTPSSCLKLESSVSVVRSEISRVTLGAR